MDDERKRRVVNRTIISVVLVIVAAVIVKGIVKKMHGDEPEQSSARLPAVSVVALQRESLPEVITLPGRIQAWENVSIAAEVDGNVVEIVADKGAEVRKGQVLVKIESSTYENAVRRAELVFADASAAHKRAAELRKTGAVSAQALEKAVTARAMSEVALAEARDYLKKCTIESPINGVVQGRSLDIGERAAVGDPVINVVGIDRVKVALDLPERDVLGVNVGQELKIQVDALNGEDVEGKVVFVAPAATAGGNSFKLEIAVDNKDRRLRPGMIVRVPLVRGFLKDVVVVPMSALIPSDGKHVAFVLDGGIAEKRFVTIQTILDDRAAIRSGLADGERLVIAGHRQLEDGVAVLVVDK
jgi:membrane fusion protein (multidrug efflux system)